MLKKNEGKYKEAIEVLLQAIKLNPNQAEFLALIVNIYSCDLYMYEEAKKLIKNMEFLSKSKIVLSNVKEFIFFDSKISYKEYW